MKKLLVPILLCACFALTAQNEEEKSEFPNAKNSYLTFDLSTPANWVAPRYRFGYIHSINEKWRIGADIGFGSEHTTIKILENYDTEDYLLFEGRFEVYHILNPTKRVNMYISGETYFIHHTERYIYDEFNSDDQDVTIRYDRADLTRNKYGVNLKFGVFVPFGDKIGVNAYIGAGPRVRDVEFSNLVNPTIADYYEDYHDGWWSNNYQNEGVDVGFNFALGIKFFYRIN